MSHQELEEYRQRQREGFLKRMGDTGGSIESGNTSAHDIIERSTLHSGETKFESVHSNSQHIDIDITESSNFMDEPLNVFSDAELARALAEELNQPVEEVDEASAAMISRLVAEDAALTENDTRPPDCQFQERLIETNPEYITSDHISRRPIDVPREESDVDIALRMQEEEFLRDIPPVNTSTPHQDSTTIDYMRLR